MRFIHKLVINGLQMTNALTAAGFTLANFNWLGSSNFPVAKEYSAR